MYDIMMSAATASLVAMSHSGIVGENFDSLYDMMLASFNDEKFLEHLDHLRPGGQITRSIKLVPENDAVCFANRLWFKVKRSASKWWSGYRVSIGINLKKSDMNITRIRTLAIARLAVGKLDDIREKIIKAEFKDNSARLLTEHVYSACYESVCELMSDIPVPDIEESQIAEKAHNRSRLEIDFGVAHNPSVTFVWNDDDENKGEI